MSIELSVGHENARLLLAAAIEPFAAGHLTDFDLVHGLGTLFRKHGTCATLIRGVADPLFIGQMQSASAFVFGLARADENDKATSDAACLWDAIAGQYWEAARQIAASSRPTHNPTREHEDDFCYVAFLLHRYLRTPDPPTAGPTDRREADLLDRWERALEGNFDPRLDLCHALCERDLDAFEEALLSTAETRQVQLARRFKKGAIIPEDLAWVAPVWPEGLALLRLAALERLDVQDIQVTMVPPLLRRDNPYRYDPGAWQFLDFTPLP